MGWKSIIDITRSEAINAIIKAENRKSLDEMSNEELKERMYGLGIGDETYLPYFGCNFCIINDEE